jgi:hypothetical protein
MASEPDRPRSLHVRITGLVADASLTGVKVAAALSRVLQDRAAPTAITVDNRACRFERLPRPVLCGATHVSRVSRLQSIGTGIELEIADRFVTISPS